MRRIGAMGVAALWVCACGDGGGGGGTPDAPAVEEADAAAENDAPPPPVDAADVDAAADEVVGFVVAPAMVFMSVGSTETFSAFEVLAGGGVRDVTVDAVWASDDVEVATVDAGVVGALAFGEAEISASHGGRSATATVIVDAAPPVLDVAITPPALTLTPCVPVQLLATAVFSDGTILDVTTLAEWSSSEPAIITVSPTGEVRAVSPGSVTIYAAYGGLTGVATLTAAFATLVGIAIAPPSPLVFEGGTVQMSAIATFSDGTTYDVTGDLSLTWSSDDDLIATISNEDGSRGLATGVTMGTTQIRATLDSDCGMHIAAPVPLTVVPSEHYAVVVEPPVAAVEVGATLQLTAVLLDTDGTMSDGTAGATWTGSAPGVAAVSNEVGSKGQVTGVAAGTATITATLPVLGGTGSDTADVAVVAEGTTTISAEYLGITGTVVAFAPFPTLEQFVIEPPAPVTFVGGAVVVYSDGTTVDETSTVTWSSNAPGVATVSDEVGSKGVAFGVAPGRATITAKLPALGETGSASAEVVVFAP